MFGGPGNAGVFHSGSIKFPVPQEDEKDPGVRRSVLWTLGWEPSSRGARPRKASHLGEAQSEEEGRKPCKTGFPHRKACSLPGSSHLISELVC